MTAFADTSGGASVPTTSGSASKGVSHVIQSCLVASVSIRDLRNHGGDVVDRVQRGERLTVTRAGRAVAELRPVAKGGLSAEELLARCRRLPPVDPMALRRDIDALVDTSLW